MNEFKKNIYRQADDSAVAPPTTVDILLGYSTVSSGDSCTNIITPVTRYIPASQDWIVATFLYQNAEGTIPAIAGYYSDGSKWYYWNESSFTSTGFC